MTKSFGHVSSFVARIILLGAGLFLPSALHAQTGGGPSPCVQKQNCFEVYKETSLSSSSESITLQAGTGRTALNVHPIDGEVYCSAAADITLSQNGTAASATTLAITLVNGSKAPTSVAFSASNVGSGTVLDKVSIPTGGGTFHWDLSFLVAYGNSQGTQNITITTSSVTATCRFKIIYTESNE